MTTPPDPAALAPWFHNLHLPGGTQTCPDHPLGLGDFPRWKWDEIAPHLPGDLTGRSTLDIGCNAGFYSFALAERGAAVTAIDHDPHYLQQARWAQPHLDPHRRVTFHQRGVYSLLHDDTAYDLILFLGVLYHLRYPLLAVDAIASRLKPGGTLVLQTLTMPGPPPDAAAPVPDDPGLNDRDAMLDPGFPKLAFIEHRWAGDPTNWFAPNRPAVEAMLRSAGLAAIRPIADETWLATRPAEPDPAARAHRATAAALLDEVTRSRP